MKTFLLTLLLSLSTSVWSGDAPINLRVNTFYEALMMSFEQKFRAEDELKEWNATELEFNNLNRIDERGNCYAASKGEVLIVLRVEESGEISGVYASKQNAKARCFIENHLGVFLPPPPFGPVYVLKRMM